MGQSRSLARLYPKSGRLCLLTKGCKSWSDACVVRPGSCRGVPPPYGEAFSKETLIPSACSKAFAATTQARIGETCSVQPYSNEIAVSDKHKLLSTGHSRDLTSNPGIWIHKLARWHTRQADVTHCMPAVLISVVLRCKTQCDYVRTLQFLPT